jgi:hypothetical protein
LTTSILGHTTFSLGGLNWTHVDDTFDGTGGAVVPGYNRIEYTIKLLQERESVALLVR